MNQTELAEHLGVSRRTVSIWDGEGLRDEAVVSESPLTYDALLAWRWRWDTKRKAKATLTDAKLRDLEAKADMRELELAKMRGELVAVEAVRKTWTSVLSRLRARIIAFKGSLAPRLVALDTPREVKAVLDVSFDELIEELQGTADDLEGDEA